MNGYVTVRRTDERVVVRLEGDVDAAMQEYLDGARTAAAGARMVDVDLRAVESFSSVGITFLVRLSQEVGTAGTTVRLIGPAPFVHEVLLLAEVQDLFVWTVDPGSVSGGTDK